MSECPICLDFLPDSHSSLDCGHSFCTPCIVEWTMHIPTCPLCRADAPVAPVASDPLDKTMTACRLYGCGGSVQARNMAKHFEKCHPLLACSDCDHKERVKKLMTN